MCPFGGSKPHQVDALAIESTLRPKWAVTGTIVSLLVCDLASGYRCAASDPRYLGCCAHVCLCAAFDVTSRSSASRYEVQAGECQPDRLSQPGRVERYLRLCTLVGVAVFHVQTVIVGYCQQLHIIWHGSCGSSYAFHSRGYAVRVGGGRLFDAFDFKGEIATWCHMVPSFVPSPLAHRILATWVAKP